MVCIDQQIDAHLLSLYQVIKGYFPLPRLRQIQTDPTLRFLDIRVQIREVTKKLWLASINLSEKSELEKSRKQLMP